MQAFPSIPRLADAPPELLASGHLWIREYVDGAPLCFRVRGSGLLVFGDRNRVYEHDDVPLEYRHAVRHVREHLDRETLREGVDDPETIGFFGVATHRRAIDYDWDRLPSFLGTDVRSERDGFLPVDVAERGFRRLGLEPVNAFAKEVRTVDFDPDSYDVPASAWYDGPAAGVVLRNKNGTRATLLRADYEAAAEPTTYEGTPDELAERYVTDRRVERAVRALEEHGGRPTFEAVYERVLESIVREEHGRLPSEESFDRRTVRSAIAARVRRRIDG